MGTYYEIKCLDCDRYGGIYADRSPHIAKQALQLADAFAALGRSLGAAMVECPKWYDLKVTVGGDRVDLYFFHVHMGHSLRIVDGYGLLLGQCPLYTATVDVCGLSEGHEGPCRKA